MAWETIPIQLWMMRTHVVVTCVTQSMWCQQDYMHFLSIKKAMKKFDIFAMVVFTITTLAYGVAGFYNPIYWLSSIASAILAMLAYIEYRSERDDFS